jgi:transposase InsO family protein
VLKPEGGGRPCWHVHRSVDLRLARPASQAVAGQGVELAEFTAAQRQAAYQRAECVRLFREAKATRPGRVTGPDGWLRQFMEELRSQFPALKISKSSLYDWEKRAGSPIDLIALIDTRGGAKEAGGSAQAWKYFSEQYLDPREPSVKLCWERTRDFAKHQGVGWCSLHSCRRQVRAGTRPGLDLETQIYYRRPAEWRSKFATYHEQDPERYDFGECWVGDHRPLDVFCLFEGKVIRPYLTTFQDWRSRRIVGWALSPSPSTDVILAALHDALADPMNGGPPTYAIVDHGKDFESYALHGITKAERRAGKASVQIDEPIFRGVFGRLGIEVVFAQPYGPQGKAREERSFATIAARFDKSLPHYTGKDTTRKPEDLTERVRKQRHLMPTLERLRERLGTWIAGHNATTDHSIPDLVIDGERLSRDAAIGLRPTRRPLPAADDLAELLMVYHRPQTVGRLGVGVTIDGQRIHFGQYQPELRPYKGTKRRVVVAFDPNRELKEVVVRDAETGRRITVAQRNALIGRAHGADAEMTKGDLKAAAKKKRLYEKAKKIVREHREVEYLTSEELAADEARQRRQADDPPSVEGNFRLVQPTFEAESSADERPKKKAAGAESDEIEFVALPSVHELLKQSQHDEDDLSPFDWSDLDDATTEDEGAFDLSMLEPRESGEEGEP